MITVVIPTVTGREVLLENCVAAYKRTTAVPLDIRVVVNDGFPCGKAWADTLDTEQYVHFTADDLEPHPGWWQAAKQVADLGMLPAPRIVSHDGALETCGGQDGFRENPTGHPTDFTRIPFLTRHQWVEIRPLVADFLRSAHYFTDNAISWAGAKLGTQTVVHRGYGFTHHWAQPGRGAGMTENERMAVDHAAFTAHIS